MTGSAHRILVFIPAYRCEAQIVRVIEQFDHQVQQMIDTVLVVDNQSRMARFRQQSTAARRS
jgi:hypothetical protein